MAVLVLPLVAGRLDESALVVIAPWADRSELFSAASDAGFYLTGRHGALSYGFFAPQADPAWRQLYQAGALLVIAEDSLPICRSRPTSTSTPLEEGDL